MRTISTTVLFCLFFLPITSIAKNVDSLLAAKITIEKPYLILNFASTDCYNCMAAGGAKILSKLSGNGYKGKIILLSDDKNMSLFFQDNQSIYGGYKTVYDKDLSNALATGPSSNACLVQKASAKSALFSEINDTTLIAVKKILDESMLSLHSDKKIKDSIFTDVSNLYFSGNESFILNDRFQIGLACHLPTKSVKYMRPGISDATADALYDKLKANGSMINSVEAKTARKMLRMSSMQMALVKEMNSADYSVLFNLYEVTIDTIIKGIDTNIDFKIYPQLVLAKKPTKGSNCFNFDNYSSYIFFDSLHLFNSTYFATSALNYECFNEHIYMPYYSSSQGKTIERQGKKLTVSEICIIELAYDLNGKTKVQHAYKVDGYEGESKAALFFRIDGSGHPVTVNNRTKAITYLQENKKISFDRFTCGSDTVANISDIAISNDTLKFVGTTTSNNCVKGVYNIRNKKTAVTKLEGGIAYQSMRINGDSILACKKNEETNELIFNEFSFNNQTIAP